MTISKKKKIMKTTLWVQDVYLSNKLYFITLAIQTNEKSPIVNTYSIPICDLFHKKSH